MSLVKHINVNDGSGRKFEDSTVGELKFDTKPEVGSFNAVTSDAVARAVAGASGEVPVVTEADNGKVLKAVYDEGGPAVEWGTGPTVDQTYDAESTNAQSGTAVAEAIGSVNAVPASAVEDAGKVLTVDADGAAAWAEAQGGGVVVVTYDTTKVAEISAAIKDAIAAGKPVVMYHPTDKVVAPMTSCTVNGNTVNAQFCITKGTSTTNKTYISYQLMGSIGVLFNNTGTIVPAVSLNTDAGKVLTAGSAPDAVSWQRVYPDIAGNAGKVLAVNSSATGTEWVAAGGSSYTAGDGIQIENDAVSAVATSDGGIMLAGPTVRGTFDYANHCVVFNVGSNPDPDAEAFISVTVSASGYVCCTGNHSAAYPVLVLYSAADPSMYAVCSRSLSKAMPTDGPSYTYAVARGDYVMRGRMSDLFGNNWTNLVDSSGNISMCLCATDTLDGTTLWGTGTGPGGSVPASSFGGSTFPVTITSSIVGKVGIALFDVPIPSDTIRFKFANTLTDPTTDSNLNSLPGTWTRISRTPNVWDYTERNTSMSSRFSAKFTSAGINVDILGANLSTPTNLSGMFRNCTGIVSVANFKVFGKVDTSDMFYRCERVATVDIRVSSTSADYMFYQCYKLTDITGAFGIDGTAISMCEDCSALKAITWSPSGVTSWKKAFKNCSSLKELPRASWGGSSFANAFENCIGLTTISHLSMSSASAGADMSDMFKGCTGLMYVGVLYCGGATNFTSAFEGCIGLLTLPTINATPTNVSSMFKGCTRVLGGAPQVYQQFAAQATPPATTTDCFTDCGSGTTVGAADLAQIPSSWGGTGT